MQNGLSPDLKSAANSILFDDSNKEEIIEYENSKIQNKYYIQIKEYNFIAFLKNISSKDKVIRKWMKHFKIKNKKYILFGFNKSKKIVAHSYNFV